MFDCERVGDVLVVTVANPHSFDLDRTAEIDAIVESLTDPGAKGTVIDLGHMPYFGSMMLESLRNVWTHIHPQGQRMALCGVSEVGQEILRLARFDTLWPICATRAEAIRTVRCRE
jgi:anti-anti-sigma regulatory factor